jgi:hypothetical protein
MKTIAQASEDSGISTTLIRSAIRQLGGKESLPDVMNGGADGGFHGFTWYSDTVPFYKRHRKEINQRVIELADDLGEDPVKMLKGWRCLDGEKAAHIGQVLYGAQLREAHTQVANGLAWFALEEVARAMCDE